MSVSEMNGPSTPSCHSGAAPALWTADVDRVEWNALRVGDHVLVHDEANASKPLVPGRVAEVQPGQRANVVAIRIKVPGGQARIVQPRRLMVHLDSGEAIERCWRCETRYAAERSS